MQKRPLYVRWVRAGYLGMVIIFAGCSPAATEMIGTANQKNDVLELDVPAENLKKISITAGDGACKVVAGSDPVIRISVELKPKGNLFSSKKNANALLEEARIDAQIRGSTLKVAVHPLTRYRNDPIIDENWIVEVPSDMALELNMKEGDVEVTDVNGGLDVTIVKGELQAEVVSGDVDIDIELGEAHVMTETKSYGDIKLRSEVGNTSLSSKGHRVKYPDPPGPGSKISFIGQGEDQIRIKLTVGDAHLVVK